MKTAIALVAGSMLAVSPSLPALAQVAPADHTTMALDPEPYRLSDWALGEPRVTGLEHLALRVDTYGSSQVTSDIHPVAGLMAVGILLGLAATVNGTRNVIEYWRVAPGPRYPELALGLSAGSAASMVGLSYMWRSMGPFSMVWGLAPLGLSVGYVYAGEPERGGTVALGTYGVLVGTSVASWLAYEIIVPRQVWKDPMWGPVSMGIGTGMALTGLYVLWSLVDVYQVAQRRQ